MFYFVVYGYRASWQNEFKGVYFASERRLDLLARGHIIVFKFFDFSKLSFLFKIFWVAILKSERFFSSLNRWSEKYFGSSIDVLHETFKIAHTYIFLVKNFYRFETVFALWFWDFPPCFICVLCRAKILPQIYTRIIASLKPPPYTRIIRERNSAHIYEKSRRGRDNVWAVDWASASWCSFVSCFVYVVIVWKSRFCRLVDVKTRCKSVMKLHKFIVKNVIMYM